MGVSPMLIGSELNHEGTKRFLIAGYCFVFFASSWFTFFFEEEGMGDGAHAAVRSGSGCVLYATRILRGRWAGVGGRMEGIGRSFVAIDGVAMIVAGRWLLIATSRWAMARSASSRNAMARR